MKSAPPRYQEWLTHVFDHPVLEEEWYWNISAAEFEGTGTEIVELMEWTFRHSGTDLLRFTDAQVNQALWYLTDSSCSDFGGHLIFPAVPLAARLAAIDSITVLFRDCFQRRCDPVLSHLSQPCESALNPVCYMFWDLASLNWLEDKEENREMVDASFAVLAAILAMDHPACQEAAIHGYGHFQYTFPVRVETTLAAYLETDIPLPELRRYAENASTGYIQ